MFGHSPIEGDKDRRVRVYADNTAVSASTAQSEYARYLNFIGDRFTAVTNTVGGVKTYDIALKYADKIIPYEAGVAKGSTPGYLNFDGDHFDVSSLASQMYTVTNPAYGKVLITGTNTTPRKLNISNATNHEALTIAEDVPNDEVDLVFRNDEVDVFLNGTLTSTKPRRINLSTAFTATDDDTNDRIDIGLASGSSGGIIPSPSGLVRGGIRDLNVPFGDGLFNMPHDYTDGDVSGGNNNTHGHYRRYSVNDSDNSLLGCTTDFSMTQLAFNPHLYGKIAISSLDDSRFILGWASVEPDTDDNVFLDNKSGFLLGFQNDTAETEDTNVQIIRNDGDATEDKVSTGLAMNSTTPFTFELWGDSATSKWKWNVNGGSYTEYSTTGGEVPTLNTNLNWNFRLETIGGDAGSLVIDVYYLYWLQNM